MGSSFSEAASFVADPLDLLGNRASARAAGDAANAQLNQQNADRAQAMRYAEATPDELNNMQKAIAFSENDIARKTKLLESADPALIEAGKNALNLLKGQEASTLAPLKANIAKQESKLRESLLAKLGPDYENSTAGIQALQAFNEQANSSLANAQQQSLGQLLGVVQNTAAGNSNLNNQMSLGQLLGSYQGRKINALQGFGVDPSLGYQGAIQGSRVFRNTLQDAAQIGGTFLGAVAGTSGAGAATGGAGGGQTLGATLGGTQVDTSQYGKYL